MWYIVGFTDLTIVVCGTLLVLLILQLLHVVHCCFYSLTIATRDALLVLLISLLHVVHCWFY